MSKGKVSEKMQRAVRRFQSRIVNPNDQYQNLSSDEASPRSGGSLRKRSSLSRSGQFDVESDDECPDPPPSDVPEGYLAVYVGCERQRFVISADYLKHQMFKALLEKSAEEYGFEHKGGLPIACDVTYFENLLWSIKTNQVNSCSCFFVNSYPRDA
ncbi:auxin-responsive protein SAUR72 [Physcomitrium patens]|uniref:Uncharacterized protein n=1 Tax=Physcomitrium patens TaxID=3218 RepID=A0A2K1KN93_PHYPA|nr:auxin-responsive protein SAUR72-like [Physcomitrium patens]PNR55250.1 hypothetical protein PHYPA_006145 [Physcomitrium patens]|eukprot:XP_024373581.1 auxin-responsive protein SAUR72-like [Physcomitrella patens]